MTELNADPTTGWSRQTNIICLEMGPWFESNMLVDIGRTLAKTLDQDSNKLMPLM